MVMLRELRRKYKAIYNDITDIDVILMDSLGIDKSKLFLNIPVAESSLREIEKKIARLNNGEPVSYITGRREFMSLEFRVNSSTLIPRADTEILVEEVIKRCSGTAPFIFEIGTGSGCIAVSLAHFIKSAKIAACDISDKALEIASLNSELNGTGEKISFFKHDIMKGFPEFDAVPDVVVSNPPYIKHKIIETLDRKVKDFEPLAALDGGIDGLDFYRKIIYSVKLNSGGLLALEIGYDQRESVENLMRDKFDDIKIIKDINANDRVILGLMR